MLQNEDWTFVEELERASKVLEKYISDGWTVKQIIPSAMNEPGFIVYLEKKL